MSKDTSNGKYIIIGKYLVFVKECFYLSYTI
uniref:Methionine-r-sulfoxide reductase b1 isoform x2 n=1 Tax=Triatoma infestans TaxID=30076 RepID=A0A170W5Y2_TRIIF